MRNPGASYRIQFTPAFGFREAKTIIPYLKKLGISDLYASPVFLTAAGSVHGYDVADPNRINPDLGTEADFQELAAALRKYNMGLIQDFVPNHMAYDQRNGMLMDILENGESSRFFRFFDIQWDHPREDLQGKILAPFLGKSYDACLRNGDIRLEFDRQGFCFTYGDLRFPLRIDSYEEILRQAEAERSKLETEVPSRIGLSEVLRVSRNFPRQTGDREGSIRRLKEVLWQLYSSDRCTRNHIDGMLAKLNGIKGDPGSFNSLDRLLSAQIFRLSFWKDASHKINYRRFFSINSLIALRQEKEEVFRHVHRLILRLCRDDAVSGLRLDHIDGLYDPSRYLAMLREETGDVYIVVEKILGKEEPLPARWSVQGTTGYEFSGAVSGLLCRRNSAEKFDHLYSRLTGCGKPFGKVLEDGKRLVLENDFSGDVDNLTGLLKRIAASDPGARDLSVKELRQGISDAVIHFPVYRTYIGPSGPDEQDRRYVCTALSRARNANPRLSFVFAFLEKTLLPANHEDSDIAVLRVDFTMRFQQLTGPVMAKGFEDTALYNYNRLLSLNDVGSFPGDFGADLPDYHRFNESRRNLWPLSLNSTATHDSKRGEDVRARIHVLSEVPEEWEQRVRRWMRTNEGKKPRVHGKPVPGKNEEYHLYQMLVGAFPLSEEERTGFCERMKTYAVKALREGKVHSSWLEPDEEYEAAVKTFVEKILQSSQDNAFLRDFIPFQRTVARYGSFNSLTQTLLKITAPGIPDFYQGTELWDLNLVDPDNRRPVDFQRRAAFLDETLERSEVDPIALIEWLLKTWEDGKIKLFLIAQALGARALRRALFERGAYQPVPAIGPQKNHLVAFARIWENQWAVVVAPLYLTALIGEGEDPLGQPVWGNTAVDLPEHAPRCWREIFTGRRLEADGRIWVSEALKHFPVSLLMNEDDI